MEKEENQNNTTKESEGLEKETPEVKKNLDDEGKDNIEQNKEESKEIK